MGKHNTGGVHVRDTRRPPSGKRSRPEFRRTRVWYRICLERCVMPSNLRDAWVLTACFAPPLHHSPPPPPPPHRCLFRSTPIAQRARHHGTLPEDTLPDPGLLAAQHDFHSDGLVGPSSGIQPALPAKPARGWPVSVGRAPGVEPELVCPSAVAAARARCLPQERRTSPCRWSGG